MQPFVVLSFAVAGPGSLYIYSKAAAKPPRAESSVLRLHIHCMISHRSRVDADCESCIWTLLHTALGQDHLATPCLDSCMHKILIPRSSLGGRDSSFQLTRNIQRTTRFILWGEEKGDSWSLRWGISEKDPSAHEQAVREYLISLMGFSTDTQYGVRVPASLPFLSPRRHPIHIPTGLADHGIQTYRAGGELSREPPVIVITIGNGDHRRF